MQQFVEERMEDPEGLLDFGKYKGHHINGLWNSENARKRSYVRWLVGYTGYRNTIGHRHYPEYNDSLQKGNTQIFMLKARDLLKGYYILCFESLDVQWKSWCKDCFHNS